MRITIRKEIDTLRYEEWSFWLNEKIFYLDTYEIAAKESKRQKKYQIKNRYDRLSSRNSTIELSEELKQEVIEKFVSLLSVEKWNKI